MAKATLYMTVNGLKTIRSMRHEIADAAGDEHWHNVKFHPDAEVLAKYAELTVGWVEEV